MSLLEHKKSILSVINIAIITISDTRTESTDHSGQLMQEMIMNHGFEIVDYKIVKDEKEAIEKALIDGCFNPNIDVIVTNGGTGLADRDVTYEVMEGLIEKAIPGYGELFRLLSFAEIGSAAMLSRAIGGIKNKTILFSTPGSTAAVKLAMEKLILPELVHIIKEIRKDKFNN